jgi:hypothetical protein
MFMIVDNLLFLVIYLSQFDYSSNNSVNFKKPKKLTYSSIKTI